MRLARHGTTGAEHPLTSGADGAWHDLRPVVGMDGMRLRLRKEG